MCEPLRRKIHYFGKDNHSDKNHAWYENNDVKSAVEFYKKYRDDIKQFEKDYPKFKHVKLLDIYNDEQRNVVFNYWLFDYCFEDVVK